MALPSQIPTKKDYPLGGSWKPRSAEDIAQLIQSAIHSTVGRVVPAASDPVALNQEGKRALQDTNAVNSFKYKVMNQPLPSPETQDYNNLVQTMVQNRQYIPGQYEQFMQDPYMSSQLPTDFYADVQRKMPYPTLLQENLRRDVGEPLSNVRNTFAQRLQQLMQGMRSASKPITGSTQYFLNGTTEDQVNTVANGRGGFTADSPESY